MPPMYIVNAIIKNSDAYKPFNRHRGIINISETRNSVSGNAQAIKEATGFKMGFSAICSLNTPYSINLLMPVYKNKIINSTAMISTKVDFVNRDDMSFANTLLFCIAGPSIGKMVDKFNGNMSYVVQGKLAVYCLARQPRVPAETLSTFVWDKLFQLPQQLILLVPD